MSMSNPTMTLRVGCRSAAALLLSVCAGIGGAQLVTALTPKTYQAHASMLVTGGADLAMPTVARLAESRQVALATAAEAGLPPALVLDRISADSQPGLQIVTLTATADQAARAATIANAAAHVLSVELATQTIGVNGPVAAHILDKAAPPTGPATPMPLLNDSVGGLLGLLAALGLISTRRRFDDRLRWPDQIEAELRLPILATIPGISRRSTRRGARSAYRRKRVANSIGEAAAILTVLAHATNYRRLLIANVRAGDETMAAALLALGLADRHDHVTLIDAQLRHSALSRHFPETKDHTLQHVLTDAGLLLPKQVNASATLTVVPAASTDAHSSTSLLRGQPFAELLANAGESSDLVLVHAPSVLESADIAVLATHTDATLLVVQAGTTRAAEAKRAVLLLQRVGTPIAGVVVIGAIGTGRSTLGWPGDLADAPVADTRRTTPPPRAGAVPESATPPRPYDIHRALT
jgi:Mrp family chromosome partitioning ATPase